MVLRPVVNQSPIETNGQMKYIAATFLRMMLNSRIPFKYKLVPILAILYVVSPFDFLPDFIPMIGWADDLIVLILAIFAFVGLAPKRNLRDSSDNGQSHDKKDTQIFDGEYRIIDEEEN